MTLQFDCKTKNYQKGPYILSMFPKTQRGSGLFCIPPHPNCKPRRSCRWWRSEATFHRRLPQAREGGMLIVFPFLSMKFQFMKEKLLTYPLNGYRGQFDQTRASRRFRCRRLPRHCPIMTNLRLRTIVKFWRKCCGFDGQIFQKNLQKIYMHIPLRLKLQ